jgi:hypothetical protein
MTDTITIRFIARADIYNAGETVGVDPRTAKRYLERGAARLAHSAPREPDVTPEQDIALQLAALTALLDPSAPAEEAAPAPVEEAAPVPVVEPAV